MFSEKKSPFLRASWTNWLSIRMVNMQWDTSWRLSAKAFIIDLGVKPSLMASRRGSIAVLSQMVLPSVHAGAGPPSAIFTLTSDCPRMRSVFSSTMRVAPDLIIARSADLMVMRFSS